MTLSLKNKIVFITGASSGIGKAAAEQFAAQGANLILTARRIERLNDLAKNLSEKYNIAVLPIELDVQDKTKVKNSIDNLPNDFKNIDILVNNAGLARGTNPMQTSEVDHWDDMIDTNVKGLLYVTHGILPGMVSRNAGHIVNIGSIAGHECYPGGNIYSATKHAVRAISKSLRIDLLGSAIRVSEIDPGMVHTEFSEVRWQDKAKSDQFYADTKPLLAEDIADAVLYCTTRPLHVDIAEIIIMPTIQASTAHIHRE